MRLHRQTCERVRQTTCMLIRQAALMAMAACAATLPYRLNAFLFLSFLEFFNRVIKIERESGRRRWPAEPAAGEKHPHAKGGWLDDRHAAVLLVALLRAGVADR